MVLHSTLVDRSVLYLKDSIGGDSVEAVKKSLPEEPGEWMCGHALLL